MSQIIFGETYAPKYMDEDKSQSLRCGCYWIWLVWENGQVFDIRPDSISKMFTEICEFFDWFITEQAEGISTAFLDFSEEMLRGDLQKMRMAGLIRTRCIFSPDGSTQSLSISLPFRPKTWVELSWQGIISALELVKQAGESMGDIELLDIATEWWRGGDHPYKNSGASPA